MKPPTLWLTILAWLTLGSSTGAAEPFLVVGYLPEHRLGSIGPEQLKGLTDLILFSVKVNKAGSIDAKGIAPESFERCRSLRKMFGFRLLLSVGGGGRSEGFAEMASSAATRRAFVADLLKLCKAEQLDGIDLDWEHPTNNREVADQAKLLQAIQKAFEPQKLKLTIAIAGWQPIAPESLKAVDRIHLMAYDAPGRHSTLKFAEADIKRLLSKGADPSKLCLGLPFYGRDIENADRALTYAQIEETFHPKPELDEVGSIYFNGPKTIADKVQLAQAKRLAGLMIWEIGQDTKTGKPSLMDVIRKTIASTP